MTRRELPDPGASRIDRIDLKGRPGDVSRHPAHHGVGYPRHRHDATELNVVTGGRGAYIVGHQRIDLAPGRLLWLFADQDHHHATANRREYRIVYFDPALWTRTGIRVPRNEEPLLRDVDAAGLRLLDALCADLAQAEPGPLAEAGFTYLLHRAWRDTLAGRSPGPQPAPLDAAMLRVITVLRDGRGSLTVTAAAQVADMSPDRFARRFRASVGCSYLTYRERVLVERACGLWTAQAAWEDLAHQAGFGSYRQFHRAFTRCCGQSPRAWAGERML